MVVKKITAPYVDAKVEDHLTKHKDVYDITLNSLEILLLGEKRDNGLCKTVSVLEGFYKDIDGRLIKIEGGITWLIRLIVGAVILAVLGLIIIK